MNQIPCVMNPGIQRKVTLHRLHCKSLEDEILCGGTAIKESVKQTLGNQENAFQFCKRDASEGQQTDLWAVLGVLSEIK